MLAELASITMFASMNGKQKKTLVAVFKDPVSGTIECAGIENLLVAAGANVRFMNARAAIVKAVPALLNRNPFIILLLRDIPFLIATTIGRVCLKGRPRAQSRTPEGRWRPRSVA